MVQALLKNRFALVAHTEQRECLSNLSSSPNTYYGCGGVSVAAAIASMTLGAPVVDETGLTGTSDVSVSFSPEGVRPFAGDTFTPAADPNLPSFRDALRMDAQAMKRHRREIAIVVLLLAERHYLPHRSGRE